MHCRQFQQLRSLTVTAGDGGGFMNIKPLSASGSFRDPSHHSYPRIWHSNNQANEIYTIKNEHFPEEAEIWRHGGSCRIPGNSAGQDRHIWLPARNKGGDG